MRESLEAHCRRTGNAALLAAWDAEKNAPMTPEDISFGSHNKVWWRCQAGHSWLAQVCSRSRGSGCPYCAGKRAWQGGNDLATMRPDLAAQWDAEENLDLKPSDVTVGSHRSVWWRCEKGHSWRSQVNSRVSGAGCPYCSGRAVLAEENSLAAKWPEVAAQWDGEKNGSLTPDQLVPGSRRKVWWRCEKGHSWRAMVRSRTCNGTGCPVCAGKTVIPGVNDLATANPRIAAQWDRVKNRGMTPQDVTPNANRLAWWRCSLGHSYRAAISARTSGSDCPYCAGRKVLVGFNDLATVEPELAKQWHPELNGTLTPQQVTAGNHRRVWWQCPYGHVWKAVIYSRAGRQRCGCPVCAGKVKRPRNALPYALAPKRESEWKAG